MAVRISLFGATELMVDGEVRPISRLQVRRLLAMLAAHESVVSADRLVEHLWPSGLPASPRKALNVALSRARSTLSPHGDLLVTVGDGYRLDECEVDLWAFVSAADALAAGRASAAESDRCRTALLQWAPPFADDPQAAEASTIAVTLEERRRAVTLRLADAGTLDDSEIDRLLARFLADHPGDEGVALAAAERHLAAGRRDDGLRLVSTTTRWLRGELGVDPSPEWNRMEHRLLEGVRSAPVTTPSPMSAPATAVVGRDDVLDRLTSGRGVTIVAGEPGIGKSAVLAEAMRCVERAVGEPSIGAAASSQPDGPLDPMAMLCGELLERGADLSGAEAAVGRLFPDAVGGRRSLIGRDEFDRQLATFVARSAGCVVIDDAQWLQDAPASVLSAIADVVDGPRILIGHNTSHDLPRSVRDAIADATTIELAPLAVADVVAMGAAAELRSVPLDVAGAIHAASGGNALLVSLLLDDWSEGSWRADGAAVPTTDVRTVIRRRLDEVTPGDVETISLAAVMGLSFRVDVLEVVDPNARTAVAAGRRAGLLIDRSSPDVVGFRHGLVAEECARRLPPARLIGVHDRLNRALRHAGASPVEYAPHALHAVSIDPLGAIEAAVAASGEHAAAFDWRAALSVLDRAVGIAGDHDADDELIAELLVRRGSVRRAMLDAGYVDDLRDGVIAADRAGRGDLFATGVTELISHGVTTTTGDVDADVGALVDSALAIEVTDRSRAELASASATFFSMTSDAARSRALYAEAISISRRVGDPTLEERVLLNAQTGFSHPDDFPQLRAAALRLSDLASSVESSWESAFLRFGTAAVLGDPMEVDAAMRTMLGVVEQVKVRPRWFGTAFSLAAHDVLRGDIDAAEARVGQVVEIGLRSYDADWVTSIASMMLLSTRAAAGTLASLRGAVDDLIEGAPGYLAYRSVRAAMAVESGDVELARADLDLLLANDLGDVQREFHWTMVLALASRAAVEIGTPAQRSLLEAELSAHAGQMTWNGVCSAGPVDAVLAELTDDASAAALLDERARRLRQRFVDVLEPLDTSAFDDAVAAAAVSAQTETS